MAQDALRIPDALREILEGDRKLCGAVDTITSHIAPVLRDNRMPFYPEYTDHGIVHVEGVIRTAWALTSDDAREAKVITPADAAALILACVLHDIAMHVSKDGFVSLVSPDSDWPVVDELGDKPWPEMWADFVLESRRFDGRTLKSLFGTPDPVHAPDLDCDDWTEKQFILVGEFLRRHHHRLAHQIARNGFPGPGRDRRGLGRLGPADLRESLEANPLPVELLDADLADVTGFIARSHGVPLREAMPYLKNRRGLRVYRGIHAVFLMALLRVADYLQVEADRAPKQILSVRDLRSPVSRREWRVHEGVKEVRSHGDDIEALEVIARPPDVEAYLRTRELLDAIQDELDTSWAVLGEVYSLQRHTGLHRLGLAIRRVTSNLDDLDTFAKEVDYVPCHAAFDTAGRELMNLLVGPLYGDNPYIGVRELMQNAVDAVREFEEYVRLNAEYADVERPDLEADVVITLREDEEGVIWLEVEDRGIGMTPDTLRNYFLKAGASLRTSDAWRETFEDEEGHSRVLRSGRFGIGVFAVLLLSDTVHVSTRHVEEEEGVEFSASLTDEFVEFRKCHRAVGTEVHGPLRVEAAAALLANSDDWDWYVLARPTLRRHIVLRDVRKWEERVRGTRPPWWRSVLLPSSGLSPGGRWVEERRWRLPSSREELPPHWRRTRHSDFDDIQWTYAESAPAVSCNGMLVVKRSGGNPFGGPEVSHNSFGGPLIAGRRLPWPKCSFFDADGNLPLDLTRTSVRLAERHRECLTESIWRDVLARVLACAPTKPLMELDGASARWLAPYPWPIVPWALTERWQWYLACTPRGITLPERWLLAQACESSTLVLCQHADPFRRDLPSRMGGFGVWSSLFTHGPLMLEGQPFRAPVVEELVEYAGARRAQLLVPKEDVPAHILPHCGEPPTVAREEGEWLVAYVGSPPRESAAINAVLDSGEPPENLARFGLWAIVEWYFDEPRDPPPQSGLAKYWMDVIGRVTIPYDLDERREVCAHAYEELAEYVEKWEELKRREEQGGQ